MSLTFADRFHFKDKDFHPKPGPREKGLSKLCSDNNAAQVYLKQILSVIETFEANSTYNSILKSESANFIDYLKDSTNQGLLTTNCEGFLQGLQSAKKADKDLEHTKKKLIKQIEKEFKQAAHDATSGKEFDI